MILLCLVLALLPLDWNSNEFRNAVLHLSGAASVEELTESELERYQSLAEHPVDLNAASRSQLMSTGFFTPFQVESILDYIRSNGDILSTAGRLQSGICQWLISLKVRKSVLFPITIKIIC